MPAPKAPVYGDDRQALEKFAKQIAAEAERRKEQERADGRRLPSMSDEEPLVDVEVPQGSGQIPLTAGPAFSQGVRQGLFGGPAAELLKRNQIWLQNQASRLTGGMVPEADPGVIERAREEDRRGVPVGFPAEAAHMFGKLSADLPAFHAGGSIAGGMLGKTLAPALKAGGVRGAAASALLSGTGFGIAEGGILEPYEAVQHDQPITPKSILKRGAGGFAMGAAIGPVSRYRATVPYGAGAVRRGLGRAQQEAVRFGGETAALTGVGAIREQRAPTEKDLALNALMIGVLRAGGVLKGEGPRELPPDIGGTRDTLRRLLGSSTPEVRDVTARVLKGEAKIPELARVLADQVDPALVERANQANRDWWEANKTGDMFRLSRAQEVLDRAELELANAVRQVEGDYAESVARQRAGGTEPVPAVPSIKLADQRRLAKEYQLLRQEMESGRQTPEQVEESRLRLRDLGEKLQRLGVQREDIDALAYEQPIQEGPEAAEPGRVQRTIQETYGEERASAQDRIDRIRETIAALPAGEQRRARAELADLIRRKRAFEQEPGEMPVEGPELFGPEGEPIPEGMRREAQRAGREARPPMPTMQREQMVEEARGLETEAREEAGARQRRVEEMRTEVTRANRALGRAKGKKAIAKAEKALKAAKKKLADAEKGAMEVARRGAAAQLVRQKYEVPRQKEREAEPEAKGPKIEAEERVGQARPEEPPEGPRIETEPTSPERAAAKRWASSYRAGTTGREGGPGRRDARKYLASIGWTNRDIRAMSTAEVSDLVWRDQAPSDKPNFLAELRKRQGRPRPGKPAKPPETRKPPKDDDMGGGAGPGGGGAPAPPRGAPPSAPPARPGRTTAPASPPANWRKPLLNQIEGIDHPFANNIRKSLERMGDEVADSTREVMTNAIEKALILAGKKEAPPSPGPQEPKVEKPPERVVPYRSPKSLPQPGEVWIDRDNNWRYEILEPADQVTGEVMARLHESDTGAPPSKVLVDWTTWIGKDMAIEAGGVTVPAKTDRMPRPGDQAASREQEVPEGYNPVVSRRADQVKAGDLFMDENLEFSRITKAQKRWTKSQDPHNNKYILIETEDGLSRKFKPFDLIDTAGVKTPQVPTGKERVITGKKPASMTADKAPDDPFTDFDGVAAYLAQLGGLNVKKLGDEGANAVENYGARQGMHWLKRSKGGFGSWHTIGEQLYARWPERWKGSEEAGDWARETWALGKGGAEKKASLPPEGAPDEAMAEAYSKKQQKEIEDALDKFGYEVQNDSARRLTREQPVEQSELYAEEGETYFEPSTGKLYEVKLNKDGSRHVLVDQAGKTIEWPEKFVAVNVEYALPLFDRLKRMRKRGDIVDLYHFGSERELEDALYEDTRPLEQGPVDVNVEADRLARLWADMRKMELENRLDDTYHGLRYSEARMGERFTSEQWQEIRDRAETVFEQNSYEMGTRSDPDGEPKIGDVYRVMEKRPDGSRWLRGYMLRVREIRGDVVYLDAWTQGKRSKKFDMRATLRSLRDRNTFSKIEGQIALDGMGRLSEAGEAAKIKAEEYQAAREKKIKTAKLGQGDMFDTEANEVARRKGKEAEDKREFDDRQGNLFSEMAVMDRGEGGGRKITPEVPQEEAVRLLKNYTAGERSSIVTGAVKEGLQNAIDASKLRRKIGGVEKGKIDIDVWGMAGRSGARVRIRDNGVGMPPNVVERQWIDALSTHLKGAQTGGSFGAANIGILGNADSIRMTTHAVEQRSFDVPARTVTFEGGKAVKSPEYDVPDALFKPLKTALESGNWTVLGVTPSRSGAMETVTLIRKNPTVMSKTTVKGTGDGYLDPKVGLEMKTEEMPYDPAKIGTELDVTYKGEGVGMGGLQSMLDQIATMKILSQKTEINVRRSQTMFNLGQEGMRESLKPWEGTERHKEVLDQGFEPRGVLGEFNGYNVKVMFGKAREYASSIGAEVYVNGVPQFHTSFGTSMDYAERLAPSIAIVNIEPKIGPTDPRYPIALDRTGFKWSEKDRIQSWMQREVQKLVAENEKEMYRSILEGSRAPAIEGSESGDGTIRRVIDPTASLPVEFVKKIASNPRYGKLARILGEWTERIGDMLADRFIEPGFGDYNRESFRQVKGMGLSLGDPRRDHYGVNYNTRMIFRDQLTGDIDPRNRILYNPWSLVEAANTYAAEMAPRQRGSAGFENEYVRGQAEYMGTALSGTVIHEVGHQIARGEAVLARFFTFDRYTANARDRIAQDIIKLFKSEPELWNDLTRDGLELGEIHANQPAKDLLRGFSEQLPARRVDRPGGDLPEGGQRRGRPERAVPPTDEGASGRSGAAPQETVEARRQVIIDPPERPGAARRTESASKRAKVGWETRRAMGEAGRIGYDQIESEPRQLRPREAERVEAKIAAMHALGMHDAARKMAKWLAKSKKFKPTAEKKPSKKPSRLARTAIEVPKEGRPFDQAEVAMLTQRGRPVRKGAEKQLGQADAFKDPGSFNQLPPEERAVHLKRRIEAARSLRHIENIFTSEKYGMADQPEGVYRAALATVAERGIKGFTGDLTPKEQAKVESIGGEPRTGIASGQPLGPTRKFYAAFAPVRKVLGELKTAEGKGIVDDVRVGIRAAYERMVSEWNLYNDVGDTVIFVNDKGGRIRKNTIDDQVVFELIDNPAGDLAWLDRPTVMLASGREVTVQPFHREAARTLVEAYSELADLQGVRPENRRQFYITHILEPVLNFENATTQHRAMIQRLAKETLGNEYEPAAVSEMLPADMSVADALAVRDMLSNRRAPRTMKQFRNRVSTVLGYDDPTIPRSLRQPYLKKRKGLPNYKRSAVTAYEAYLRYALRKIHLEPAVQEARDVIVTLPGKGEQAGPIITQREYAEQAMAHLLGKPYKADQALDRLTWRIAQLTNGRAAQVPGMRWLFRPRLATRAGAGINRFQYFRLLGLALDSTVTNLTQVGNTWMRYGGWRTMEGYARLAFAAADGLLSKTKLTRGNTWKALQRQNLMSEFKSYFGGPEHFLKDPTQIIKRPLTMAERVALSPFTLGELVNRGAAFFAGMSKARQLGLSFERSLYVGQANVSRFLSKYNVEGVERATRTSPAEWYAKRGVIETQFGYSPAESAPMFGKPGGRVMFQFFSYPTQQVTLIYDGIVKNMLRPGGPRDAGMAIRAMALAGLYFGGGAYITEKWLGFDSENLFHIRGQIPRSLGPNVMTAINLAAAIFGDSWTAKENLKMDYGRNPAEWVTPRAIKKVMGITHRSLGEPYRDPYRYLPIRPVPPAERQRQPRSERQEKQRRGRR